METVSRLVERVAALGLALGGIGIAVSGSAEFEDLVSGRTILNLRCQMTSDINLRPPGRRLVIDWNGRSLPSVHVHKYGGTPSNGANLPICGGCGEHLHLLLQIDLADPQLDHLNLSDLDYLLILTCLNCAGYWKPTYYRLENRGQGIALLQEKPGLCVREFPDPLEEYPV